MITQLTQLLGFSKNSQLISWLSEGWGTCPCDSMLLLVRYDTWGHSGQGHRCRGVPLHLLKICTGPLWTLACPAQIEKCKHWICLRFPQVTAGFLHRLLLREWWQQSKIVHLHWNSDRTLTTYRLRIVLKKHSWPQKNFAVILALRK